MCGVCLFVSLTCKSFVRLGVIPSAMSLRRAGVEQLYQVKRMIGGLENMLFSTYSQTENVEDPRVFWVNVRST